VVVTAIDSLLDGLSRSLYLLLLRFVLAGGLENLHRVGQVQFPYWKVWASTSGSRRPGTNRIVSSKSREPALVVGDDGLEAPGLDDIAKLLVLLFEMPALFALLVQLLFEVVDSSPCSVQALL